MNKRFTRFLGWLLALAMLLGAIAPVTPLDIAHAESAYTAEDFKFAEVPIPGTEDENGWPDVVYSLVGFSESGLAKLATQKTVVLPGADAKGRVPEWIEDDSFKGLGIEHVTIPGNYKIVQFRAFQNSALQSVVLEEGVEQINESAFENCHISSLTLPSTFTYAASKAFKNNQLTELAFPASVKGTGPESFMNNRLTTLTLSPNMQVIYARAFKGNQLTEVRLPSTLKNRYDGILPGIAADAFDDNPGKANPLNPSENKVLLWTPDPEAANRPISAGNFVVDPIVQSKEYLPADFTYEDGLVTGFSEAGKKKYDRLGEDTPLVFPAQDTNGNPVTGIGDDYAFQDDVIEVKQIVLPEGYTRIGDLSFWEATVDEVVAPSTLKSIGSLAFFNSASREVTVKVQIKDLSGITNESRYVKLVSTAPVDPEPQPAEWTSADFNFGNASFKIGKLTLPYRAVTGFSVAGLKKLETNRDVVLPTKDMGGKPVKAIANNAFKTTLGADRMDSVAIPEGYVAIGEYAFAFNGIKGAQTLPQSLQFIGQSAFFRNKLTSVNIPPQIKDIPLSLFRNNELTQVTIQGDLVSIGKTAFLSNHLTTVAVPDSLKTIGKDAFKLNDGVAEHENKVVLTTASGTNPNSLPGDDTYIVDPSAGPVSNEWTTDDFEYDGQKVTGFSAAGREKVENEKAVVVPDLTPDKKPVLEIADDAFRNLDAGYDIESIVLPDTVTRIGDYALQFNAISEFTIPRDCTFLGLGVMMSNPLSAIHWNEKLETIDQACFFACPLEGTLTLPASLVTVKSVAFRQCDLTKVVFTGNNLRLIGDKAFSENHLTSVVLPEGVQTIDTLAFADNELTEVNIPASLRSIANEAFARNPGVAEYKAVVLHTPGAKNPNKLVDDPTGSFVVDPGQPASDEDIRALKDWLAKAKAVDQSALTQEFATFLAKEIAAAEKLDGAAKKEASDVTAMVARLKSAGQRSELSKQMKRKQDLDAKSSTFDQEQWKTVQAAYEEAAAALTDNAVTAERITQLTDTLRNALDRLSGTDPMKGAVAYEGEHRTVNTHFVVPYTVKLRVWVKDGVIVQVEDNGTVYDQPGQDVNKAFFKRALPMLTRYAGKSVEEVKAAESPSAAGIDTVSGATVTSDTFHLAVLDALSKVPAVTPEDPTKWSASDFTYGNAEFTIGGRTVTYYAVTGFTAAGEAKLEKNPNVVLPAKSPAEKPVLAVANNALTGTFGEDRMGTLTIPEGYVAIGQMAFAFNGIDGDLVLPQSLEYLGMGAFFRNAITSVNIPERITNLPISVFRGNKLATLTIQGNLQTIERIALTENRLTEVAIPDSLRSIGEGAFGQNAGSPRFDGKVVLRTRSGNNPQHLPGDNTYIVDPSGSGEDPGFDYKTWVAADFEYEGQTVVGFSAQGHKKIKQNKALVIPDMTPDGKPVLEIGVDAFRNLNAGYDIESVTLPATVREIGDYAFQFNDIEEFTTPRDCERFGMGILMMNPTVKIHWNEKLSYIGHACFFMCPLEPTQKLPASLATIELAAFRKCGLTKVEFSGNNLRTIGGLAFADNKLSSVVLPEGLETIGNQAFGNNRFTELNVPASLKDAGFQTFTGNPGVAEYKAVVLHTPEGKNPNHLKDDPGKTYVIDPAVLASEEKLNELKQWIQRAEKIDQASLTESFASFYAEELDAAKDLLKKDKKSVSSVDSMIARLRFALNRAPMAEQMKRKETKDPKSASFDKKLWNEAETAYQEAKRYLMVINISDARVQQITEILRMALDRLDGIDPLNGAKAYEGEYMMPETHYITPYLVKVRVWVKDGTIVYVENNGTVHDDPSEEEEHNGGYFRAALPMLLKYVGKTVEEVKNAETSTDLGIDAVSGSTVTSGVFHLAILNALEKVTDQKSGLVEEADGLHYYDPKTGKQLVNAWKEVDKKTYYFGENGVALKGLQKLGDQLYYFDEKTCVQLKDAWKAVNGKTYYFNPHGPAYRGIRWIKGQLYFFDEKTCVQLKDAWKTVNGRTYYFNPYGPAYRGLRWMKGELYYFDPVSAAQWKECWRVENGRSYYFNSYGVAYKGLRLIAGVRYYFDEVTRAQYKNRWKVIGDKTYYFNAYGVSVTGLYKLGAHTYGFDSNGVQYKDCTVRINGKLCTFNKYGVLR